jgi:multicomponent Na+:H+ antiporter subunit E
MFRSVSVIVTLFAFWLVLSGYFTAFLIGMGVLSAIAVTAFAHRMEVVDHEGHPVHLTRKAFTYWPWLLKEIVKSAWGVSRIILNPRLPISPTMVRIQATQKTPVGKVVYANSITLTPATISVTVEDNEILVHALTRQGAEQLQRGDMDRRVTAFEGSGS